jgi:hypothetical protein
MDMIFRDVPFLDRDFVVTVDFVDSSPTRSPTSSVRLTVLSDSYLGTDESRTWCAHRFGNHPRRRILNDRSDTVYLLKPSPKNEGL